VTVGKKKKQGGADFREPSVPFLSLNMVIMGIY
jgi:hypothetical protein